MMKGNKLTAKDISELISHIKRFDKTFSKGEAEVLWVFKMIKQRKISIEFGVEIAVDHCIYQNISDCKTMLICHLNPDQIVDNLGKEKGNLFRNEAVKVLKQKLTLKGLESINLYLKELEVVPAK